MIRRRAPRRGKRRARRGQSEVIGGLIVLTLLFAFAVPMILNSYNSTVQMTSQIQQTLQAQKTHYNEKIEIKPLDPNNEAYIRAGWIPGVFINNTGTVAVTIERLYLVNKENNTIYKVYDLRYARETTTPDIDIMLVDVDLVGGGQPPPPVGQPITLKPGENLLIVFNETILPFAPHLVVLVESANGVMHPLVGTGTAKTLYPGRPGSGGGSGTAPPGAWRGIFAPQSGFLLIGYDELIKYSSIWGERPCYRISWSGPSYYGWAYDNDPDVPPYYRIEYYRYWSYRLLRGFLGTFDMNPDNVYYIRVDGWHAGSAYSPCINRYTSSWQLSRFMTSGDMDRNGVNELIFYTYWIHYYGGWDRNPDSDFDGYSWSDSIAMFVQAARDISGVDFVKISAKIIYDMAISGSGEPHVPLKVFSLAVWEYDDGRWKLYSTKDFDFVNNGPKTFVVSATFPLHRDKTYRVGVIFYDPIKRTYDGAYYEFMMGLEHMIVEYGVLNPYFQESPPLYIIAIPDPNLISGIGEQDFARAYNITNINEAKLRAQETLLNMLEEELNYAGISGYTIIRTQQEACDLLFGSNPPKYAVIIWLQGGNISVPYTLYTAYGFRCSGASSDYNIFTRIRDYHWVWVWPMETPFASTSALQQYNNAIRLTPYGNYTANITEQGIQVRIRMYAFYLFNTLKFKHQVYFESPYYESLLLITNGTFYKNETSTGATFYGTSAYWVYVSGSGGPGTGAIVLNPVHVDWDVSGDGVVPDTLVQQIIYAALETWNYVIENT